jgi:hypothetical protein
MAHTSRCGKAAGPLSKCRCSCGGSRHGGADGTRPLASTTAQARLPVTENPRVAKLRVAVTSGIEKRQLLGGQSGSKTELLTCTDGTRVVSKGVGRWQEDYCDADHQRDAEVLGPVMVECAGLPAPAVYVDDDGRILMERLDAEPAAYVRYGGVTTLMLAGGPDGPGADDAWALALADTAMSNSDRNGENWGIKDGRIGGTWDHATCFDWGDQNPHGPPTGRLLGNFNEWLAVDDGWRVDVDVDDRIELTVADVERFKRRLKANRHRFTDPSLRRNRLAWWRKSMARVNSLQAHLETLPPRTRNRIR